MFLKKKLFRGYRMIYISIWLDKNIFFDSKDITLFKHNYILNISGTWIIQNSFSNKKLNFWQITASNAIKSCLTLVIEQEFWNNIRNKIFCKSWRSFKIYNSFMDNLFSVMINLRILYNNFYTLSWKVLWILLNSIPEIPVSDNFEQFGKI